MATALKGAPELRARLKALQTAWKPIGRNWGRSDVAEMRAHVPVRAGRLRKSFRVTSATGKRTRVGGHFTGYFVDKGPKAHVINPKRPGGELIFRARGRTIFARQVHHRGYRGRPFRVRAAVEALRKNPMAQAVIDAWNKAA